jgi:phosphoserine phosphatase RsbU/P
MCHCKFSSLGYVGVQTVFTSERRLLSIEKELEVAQQLQSSILPVAIPEIQNLRIAVSYQPMTAVAGDFYEFLARDEKRIGFLVADVTGHGVPGGPDCFHDQDRHAVGGSVCSRPARNLA